MPTDVIERRELSQVFQVLQEEYQAKAINREIMQQVLGRARRTCYNYLEGITPLHPSQIFELSIRLGNFRLLNAYFQDIGFPGWIMPRIKANDIRVAAERARAEVDGYDALTEFFRTIEEAFADGIVTDPERADIERGHEKVQGAIAGVALGVEGVRV